MLVKKEDEIMSRGGGDSRGESRRESHGSQKRDETRGKESLPCDVRDDWSSGKEAQSKDKRDKIRGGEECRGGLSSKEVSSQRNSPVESKMDSLRENSSKSRDATNKSREYFEDDVDAKDLKSLSKEEEGKLVIKHPEAVLEAPMPGAWERTEDTNVPSWDLTALLEDIRPDDWHPPTPTRVPISLMEFKEYFVSEILQPPRMEIAAKETILKEYRDIEEKEPLVLFDHECVIRTNLRGIRESKKRREEEEKEEEREYRLTGGGLRGRGGFGGGGRWGSRGGRVSSRGRGCGSNRGHEDKGGDPNKMPIGQRRRFGNNDQQVTDRKVGSPREKRLPSLRERRLPSPRERRPPSPRERRPPSPRERRPPSPRESRPPSSREKMPPSPRERRPTSPLREIRSFSPSSKSSQTYAKRDERKEFHSLNQKSKVRGSSQIHGRRSEADPRTSSSYDELSKSSKGHASGYSKAEVQDPGSSGTSTATATTYKQYKEQKAREKAAGR